VCEREKLLPCPCCGASNPREYVHDSYLVIECTKCNLFIKRALSPSAEWEKGAIACRKAWNTRPFQTRGDILRVSEYSNFSMQREPDCLEFSCPKSYGERFRVTVEHIRD